MAFEPRVDELYYKELRIGEKQFFRNKERKNKVKKTRIYSSHLWSAQEKHLFIHPSWSTHFSVKKINIRQAVCPKHKIKQDGTHILRSATFQYSGMVPLYVYSSLYVTIKLTFSNELVLSSPGHSIGVLNSKHFKSIFW